MVRLKTNISKPITCLLVIIQLTSLLLFSLACSSTTSSDEPVPVAGQDAQPPEADASDAKESEPEVAETSLPEASFDAPDSTDTSSPEKVATPTLSPPGGTYYEAIKVEIQCATAGAIIYYTVDGSAPTDQSAVYLEPLALSPPSETTLRAFARASGRLDSEIASAVYVLATGTEPCLFPPSFAPPGGTYATPQTVTLTSASAGVQIHYTDDNSTPTEASPLYAAPIAVSKTTTLKAVAIDPTKKVCADPSPVSSATYTFQAQAAAPVFSVPSGSYCAAQLVEISSATPNAHIHYTTDGSPPTSFSPEYVGPIAVPNTMTIKAFASASGLVDSSIAEAAYVIQACFPATEVPTFWPPGGTYCEAQTVAINCATPSAEIHYTTDGTEPTAASTLYAGPVAISSSLMLKAFAVAPNYSPSPIGKAIYEITLECQTDFPTIAPNGGSFCAPVVVTLSTTEPNGTILYTLDGTLPSVGNGIPYSGPFTLDQTVTLAAVTIAPGVLNSNPSVAQYQFGPCLGQVALVDFAPLSTSSDNAIGVTLSTATSGATICYATDGSTPACEGGGTCVTGGTYELPVLVTETGTTLRAIACKAGYEPSLATEQVYTLRAGTVVFSPGAGAVASGTLLSMSSSTQGASLRYTADGTDPTCTTGIEYQGPSAVSVPVTFRAIACKSGFEPSGVATATYTISN